MASPTQPRTAHRTESPHPDERAASPPEDDFVRDEMPTLVDDDALEAARAESERRSSLPPAPPDRPSDGSIEVVWDTAAEHESQELFSKYVRLLGKFTRVPIVTVSPDRLQLLSMDSRVGFLIAQMDGASSIQTLLDMHVMPPREVLHALVTLRDLGIIELRDG